MPVTNFKISMNEYMRLVAEDAKKAEEGTIYKSLLTNLSELAEMTEEYYKTDAEGNAKVLVDEDYDKLIDKYTKLAEDCGKFLSGDHDKNRLENNRISMITKLSLCVGKDLSGLKDADRTKERTLSGVVKDARIKIVDLTGKSLGRVGDAVSDRIPLKSVSGTVGFFTKKSVYENVDTLKEIMDRIPRILPAEFLEEYNDGGKDDFLQALKQYSVNDIHSEDDYVKNDSYEALAKILQNLKPEMEELDLIDMLKREPEFAENLQKLQKDYLIQYVKTKNHNTAGIKNDSRIDQRNAAMSDVAALLGMSRIVARATPMKIIQGGRVIEGTFMEKAEGEDVRRLTQNSKMLQANKDSFNHPEGLKALADLQVLDYICGNIDRHCANMMYQFGEENGKVVLTGVCGIDNDTSFGTELFREAGEGKEITPLSSIKNISSSCYETLMGLQVDTLRVILADKLSAEEVDAACKRASLLKQKILSHQEALEEDRELGIEEAREDEFNVVQDKEWGQGNYTYDKLTARRDGITRAITDVINVIGVRNQTKNTLPREASKIEYAEGKDVTDQAEVKFQEIYSKLESFVTRAGNLRRKLHVNSEEYNNMLRSLKTALDSGKDIKEALQNNENVNLDRFKEFAQTVVALGISSQEYMSAKNLSQRTELGKDRFALATDMRDLAQENFAIKEAAPEVKKPEAVKEPEQRMML